MWYMVGFRFVYGCRMGQKHVRMGGNSLQGIRYEVWGQLLLRPPKTVILILMTGKKGCLFVLEM